MKVAVFLASCGSVAAFSPPLRTPGSSSTSMLQAAARSRRDFVSPKYLANLMKKDRLPSEAEAELGRDTTGLPADPVKARWMRWMRAGTPRGVDEVKMREAWELGGVPRSDRYSSS